MSAVFGTWPPGGASGVVTFAAVAAALAAATGPVSFNGQELENIATPTASTSAATRAYVDAGDATTLTQAGVAAAAAIAAALSGGGYVHGSGATTDDALAVWSGAGGTQIKNSTVLLSAGGALTQAASVNGLVLNAQAAPSQLAIGTGAAHFGVSTAAEVLALGHGVLASLTTGGQNVCIGTAWVAGGQAAPGAAMTTGNFNTLLGTAAGAAATTADQLVVLGARAGQSLTTGRRHTLVGYAAGILLTTGNDNTFVGALVGQSATTATTNVGVGRDCLALLSTGTSNVCMGVAAGSNITTGGNNTCIGTFAGNSIVTGNTNVIIGRDSGPSVVTDSNIIIGFGATSPDVTLASQISIGSLLWGDGVGARMRIGGTGSLAAQIQKALITSTGADSVPVLGLASTGANGALVSVYAGTRDPTGAVSANAGSVYLRVAGIASGIYSNRSAADPGTTWVLT